MKTSLAILILVLDGICFGQIAAVESFVKSPSCGPIHVDIKQTPAPSGSGENTIGESLRVFFDDFHLSATQAGEYKKDCRLDAAIRIPAGYRFLPKAAYAEGSYRIQPENKSQGFINVSYDVRPVGRTSKKNNQAKPWTGTNDFICKGELEETQYLACANHDTYVTLGTNLNFRLQQKAGGQSLIELDTTRKDADLTWDWQFQPCVNFFEGRTFDVNLYGVNVQDWQVRMHVYQDGGTMVGENQTHGTLSHISYTDDGMQAFGVYDYEGVIGSFQLMTFDLNANKWYGFMRPVDESQKEYSSSGILSAVQDANPEPSHQPIPGT